MPKTPFLLLALTVAMAFAAIVYGCTQHTEPVGIVVDPYTAVQVWCDDNPCACDDVGHKYLMEE